jgi:hypothetical protein
VPITPDTKDWTWVLERPCPECGFDAKDYPRDSLAEKVRANARSWTEVLGGANVGVRPSEDVWSPLEYGCHVRDVYRTMDARLSLLLTEDHPTFQNWDQDETALEERYDLQNPAIVAGELSDTASSFATRWAAIEPSQWDRQGTRSNGSLFSVATLGTYCLHDVVHHLWDVSPTSTTKSAPTA